MTKQESCDSISDILGLEHPELSEGSTIPGEFLHDVLLLIDSDGKKDGKHDTFDAILETLGTETSDDYKSEGSTITEDGIGIANDALEIWSQLSTRILGDSIPINPRLVTQTILVDYLSEWTSAISNLTDNPQELFAAMDIELNQYPVVGVAGVLSIYHAQFCLSRIPEKDVTSDQSDEGEVSTPESTILPGHVGDVSEESPSSGSLMASIEASNKIVDVESLYNKIRRDSLDLNPPWQRKVVWTVNKQRELIRSIVLGFPLPSLILFKPKGSTNIEVVDGKQRLTSLVNFLENKIAFPRVNVNDDVQLDGFSLRDCSNRYVDDIPSAAKEKILSSELHTSTLKDVEENTVYDVFTIYNSKGTRLNAAEIRNAAYQKHAIHQMMVEITGELVDDSEWDDWTTMFRSVIGNNNPNLSRYKYLGFIERYLGYSRAHPESGRTGFMRLTTAKSIKAFYDTEDKRSARKAKKIAKETKLVFDWCLEIGSHLLVDYNGRFHALRATNSMILIRLLGPLIDDDDLDKGSVQEIFVEIYKKVELPENQNTGTIWGFHTDSIRHLWDNCLTKKQREKLDDNSSDYLDKLYLDRWD